MGQGSSGVARQDVPIEDLSRELANRFATKCFTPLELYSFKDVFRTLADCEDEKASAVVSSSHPEKEHHEGNEHHVYYWKEETLAKFLELPDQLQVAPVIFQSASYLGAFPFESLAPSILSFEALVKVVTIMTERYGKVLKKSHVDRAKVLFRSIAVYDRRASVQAEEGESQRVQSREKEKEHRRQRSAGFDIDHAVEHDSEDEKDENELALAALDALDAIDAFKYGEQIKIHHAQIPTDNFRRLIMLMIVLAPLDAMDSLSSQAERYSDSAIEGLRKTADNLLWAFGVEQSPGIFYHTFEAVIHNSAPYLFDGLDALFEHFLFSKNLDLSQHREGVSAPAPEPERAPLLPQSGEILDLDTLSQLSFFIKGSQLFRQLRPLYFGDDAGFSMGSFESKVLKWMAPTILLVSGTIISRKDSSLTARAKEFLSHFDDHSYASGAKGNDKNGRVVFGVYLHTPWKASAKDCFGDEQSLLFQLEPIHEVFRASTVATEYAYFSRAAKTGMSFGCAAPKSTSLAATSMTVPGAVSLLLDDSLEFGVFTHTAEGGGSYHASKVRQYSWQDCFEVESLEVWGCGGDEEAARQRQAWAFEEREALLRRHVNLGKDTEADRALLEMAGLIGNNRSGGSMG